mmetsp:Transcript_9360/g.25402  ORF Transcript_9360/g.25402 Transcript_9360/m.25402 type:complete len:320 (+) Transcript_9360:181-1140(+)
MAGRTKGSLAFVPPESMKTLFFNNTTSDYAGEALVPGSEQQNFYTFREQLPPQYRKRGTASIGAAHARQRRVTMAAISDGESSLAPSFTSVASKASLNDAIGKPRRLSKPKWDSLTAYTQNYWEKPLDGLAIDREVARGLREMNNGREHMKLNGNFLSSYGALCKDLTRGGASRPDFVPAGENGLRELISPSANSIGTPPSFASTQHAPPPQGMISPCSLQLPRDEIGRVPKAADFFTSESRREFDFAASHGGLGASSTSPPSLVAVHGSGAQRLRRAASAPGGPASLRKSTEGQPEEDPARMFRRAMMRTQYQQTFSM